MNKKITQLTIAVTFLVLSCMSAYAQQVDSQVCQSYINMFCVRCHTAHRICNGIGSKSDKEWQDTIRLMGKYGNLDNATQTRIYECVSGKDARSSNICKNDSVFTERAAAMTVSNIFDSGQHARQTGENIFRSIEPEEALRMLQARDDVIFLDVRTPQERSQAAIPGSKLVSIYSLLKGEIPLPKDKPILLVCAVGGRSYVAGQVLAKNGYREVYNLRGGVNGWHKAGLPLIYGNAVGRK